MHRNEPWTTPAIVWGMKAGAIAGALHGFWIGGFSDAMRGEVRFWGIKKQLFFFTLCGIFNGVNFGWTTGHAYDKAVKYSIQIKNYVTKFSSPDTQNYTNSSCDALMFFKRISPNNIPAPRPEKATINKV